MLSRCSPRLFAAQRMPCCLVLHELALFSSSHSNGSRGRFPAAAYGDGAATWTIFNGFFDWHNQNWEQSGQETVKPGDVIDASVVWNAQRGIYDMCECCIRGMITEALRTALRPQTLARTAPLPCTLRAPSRSLPPRCTRTCTLLSRSSPPRATRTPPTASSSSRTSRSRGRASWRPRPRGRCGLGEEGPRALPRPALLTLSLRLCLCAQVHQFQPACNSQGQIVSPSSVKFTWNTQ